MTAITPEVTERRRRGVAQTLRDLVGVAAVAFVGGVIGWMLAPAASVAVGPLHLTVAATVGDGPAAIDLPPVGEVAFDTHSGPLGVRFALTSVDVAAAEQVLSSPQALEQVRNSAPAEVRAAVLRAIGSAVGLSVLAAEVAGYLVYRRAGRGVVCAVLVLVPALVTAGWAAATFDPGKLEQPRFTGLLAKAPYVAGQAQATADRLEAYRSGIEDMVRSVTTIYATADQLPVLPGDDTTTVVLHVSDIHLNPQAFDLIAELVRQFRVDAVLDTGDITTWGTAAESATFAPIGGLGVPYVFVRGNHDSQVTAAAVAAQSGAIVLDGTVQTVAGLRVAGIGDFAFTPDGSRSSRQTARDAARSLAARIVAENRDGSGVDIAMIHDPRDLAPLMGTTPLVLAGHLHTPAVRVDPSGTRVMIEGSTGGAGISKGALTRLEAGDPLPLEATLLYFDTPSPAAATGTPESRPRLVAFDHIRVGGLGLAEVSIQRTVIGASETISTAPIPDVTPVDRTIETPTGTTTITVSP